MSKYQSIIDAFTGIELQYAKQVYYNLCKRYHPDISGDEYEDEFKFLNSYYQSLHKKNEKDGDIPYSEIIKALSVLPLELTFELIGTWLYIFGITKDFSEKVRKMQLGIRWHSKRQCWFTSPTGTYRGKKSTISTDTLRVKYGSTLIAKSFNNILTS